MTINTVKIDLLTKVAESLKYNDLADAERCIAMYSTLCHADTQDKMTDAAIGEYGHGAHSKD